MTKFILLATLLLCACATTCEPTVPGKVSDDFCKFPPIQVSRTDSLKTRQDSEAAWKTYNDRCKS